MTKYPELNDKLIDCVVRHITNHPDEYNQNVWAVFAWENAEDENWCGTQCCFAGWAVLLSTPVSLWGGLPNSNFGTSTFYYRTAAQRLGLTVDEAAELFASTDKHLVHNPSVIKSRLRKIRFNRGLPPREYGLPEPEQGEMSNTGADDGQQKT